MPNRHIDEGRKIQAPTMLVMGRPIEEITPIVGISKAQIHRLRAKAASRGWGADKDSPLDLRHVEDEARSGRPRSAVEPAVLQTIAEANAEANGSI